jgi:hypothetical protein
MWASVRRAAPSLLPLFALLRPVERADLWRARSSATPCVLAPACSRVCWPLPAAAVCAADAPSGAAPPTQDPANPAPRAARWARCGGLAEPAERWQAPWHTTRAPARPLRGRRA